MLYRHRKLISYVKFARQTVGSDIFQWRPDKWFKIWFLLICLANYKDALDAGFKRGEFFTDYQEIAQYTKATRNEIDHCFRWLKKAKMIATTKATRGVRIKILKYDTFQDMGKPKSDSKSDSKSDGVGDTNPMNRRLKSDTIVNKINNINNILYISEELKKIYPPSLLEEFLLYWNEPDSKDTPRWKKQKTWNTAMRLKRWKMNQDKWNHEKNQRFKKIDEMPKGEPRKNSDLTSIGNIIKSK